MTIIGDYGSGQVPRLYAAQTGGKPARPSRNAETRPPEATRKVKKKEHPKVLHDSDSLRAGAEKLIDSGEMDATTDGQIRERRVEEARRNKEAGTYDRQDVIGSIVDRLLDKWNI